MDETLVILEAELKRLRDGAFEAWKTFMSWYTWFFGTNLLVLGWLLTPGHSSPLTGDPTSQRNAVVLATFWMLFSISGAISALKLRAFCASVSEQTAKVCELMTARVATLALKVPLSSGFAGRLSSWGAMANAITMLVLAGAWGYVLVVAMSK